MKQTSETVLRYNPTTDKTGDTTTKIANKYWMERTMIANKYSTTIYTEQATTFAFQG
jgi:hypothetical protein